MDGRSFDVKSNSWPSPCSVAIEPPVVGDARSCSTNSSHEEGNWAKNSPGAAALTSCSMT